MRLIWTKRRRAQLLARVQPAVAALRDKSTAQPAADAADPEPRPFDPAAAPLTHVRVLK